MGNAEIGVCLRKETLLSVENKGLKLKSQFIYNGASLWWSIRNVCAKNIETAPKGKDLFIRFFSIFLRYMYYKKISRNTPNKNADVIVIEGITSIIYRNNRYVDNVNEKIIEILKERGFKIMRIFLPLPINRVKRFQKKIDALNNSYILPVNPYKKLKIPYLDITFISRYILQTTYRESASAFDEYMNIFGRVRPSLVFIYNEYGALRYPAVSAARRLGIPVVAIQHGIIHEEHPGYFHIEENISKSEKDLINYVLPDVTCVYGPYEKRLLQEYGSFPSERIQITGSPRYDDLFKKISNDYRKNILKKYGIVFGKKYLLWPTQTHDSTMEKNGENEVNADMVFSEMKKLNDWKLIIKLHPGEDQRAKLYRKMSKKYDLPVSILGKDADTVELLSIADAVIIKNSTVGMEAIFMGKPIILLNIIKSHSLRTYTEYGFDLMVERKGDLPKILKQIETDDFKDDFKRKRDFFIKERCANPGKATEAVWKVLGSYLKN